MNSFKEVMLALLFLVHGNHAITIFTSNTATVTYPFDSFAISCGSSRIMIDKDGRDWLKDVGYTSSSSLRSKSTIRSAPHQTAIGVDPTPYKQARISHHEFTYMFHVRPGQKFIRLHFFKAAYDGFQKSSANFSVKSGKFTLISNFNLALDADASADKIIVKEFCVNIKENEELDIVFSPLGEAKSKDVYAFINGIEIVSMPAGLYFTPHIDTELGAKVIGQRKYKFHVDDNETVLEMVRRLNIGGNSIPSFEDGSLFRGWDSDSGSLSQADSDYVSINRDIKILYKDGKSYFAPKRVYQSAKTTPEDQLNKHNLTRQKSYLARVYQSAKKTPENQLNKHNLTWTISVDYGFSYLIRLHFCELEPAMMKDGFREFSIVINNEIAKRNASFIKWGGGPGVPLYRDFVVILKGNPERGEQNLVITLEPKIMSNGTQTKPILNGLEIFKIHKHENHGTSRSVVNHIQSPTLPWFPKQMQVPSFGSKNVIAAILIIMITVFYYTSCLSGRSSVVRSTHSQCREFSLNEIRSATNNFHDQNVIGSGGFGKVYKGRVDRNGGIEVAIKQLSPHSRQGEHEFQTEIQMLSKLKHENLVPLIGYCSESQEYLLVYEYMNRGTLHDHLHMVHPPLSWDQRLKILIGAATGLCFVHEKQVIHRDIKSSNILIDLNWVAKLSDFGLSRTGPSDESLLSHVITVVKGTIGYLCPEYFQTEKLSLKSDVYSFGVVLLEVVTGRPAVDKQLPVEDEQRSLVIWARNQIEKGDIEGIVDPTLSQQITPACLRKYVKIAERCLERVPQERPSMLDVVRELNSVLVYNDDTTGLIPDTITSMTEDDTKISMEEGNDISRSAKPGTKEEDMRSKAPYKKWWNLLLPPFSKIPKVFHRRPKNSQKSQKNYQ